MCNQQKLQHVNSFRVAEVKPNVAFLNYPYPNRGWEFPKKRL